MRFLFLVAVGVVAYLLWKLYFKSLLAQGRQGQMKIALVGLGLLLLVLALTGRAPAIFVAIGAILTQVMRFAPLLVRFAPSLRQWLGNGSLPGGGPFGAGKGGASQGGAAGGGRVSQVRTRTLLMRLDQDSGEMSGTVLAGDFEGRELADMSNDELATLHERCRHDDADALRLLEAWLVRERGESWGASGAGESGANGGAAGGGAGGSGPGGSDAHAIGETEAREILGVGTDATRDDIVAAHRSLMGRLHPDKGGSTWLAARVNEARRVLIEALG